MKTPLRTLLALSDPECEPEFRDLLERRLRTPELREEAELLLQRIRRIVGLPLRAPEWVDGAEEIDPNLVANYLDHHLSLEEEEKFESFVLRSDVYLVELADLYRILTHSLGQPAKVPSGCRNRLYAIPKTSAPLLSEESGSTEEEPEIEVEPPSPPISAPHSAIPKTDLPSRKRVQESLNEWKWERWNRLKNIVVLLFFLAMGLVVWGNRDAIERFAKSSQPEEKGFEIAPQELTEDHAPSVLDTVQWNEAQEESLLYTQLESPESVLKKTEPNPIRSGEKPSASVPPPFLKKRNEVRPAAF